MSLPSDFNSGFNRKSSAANVTERVDLSGKTVLITGVGSGLGNEAMRVLAMRGAHVIGLDRTMDAAETACAGVTDGTATPFECDLSDPKSVVACADTITKKFKVIDIILTNAGVMAPPYTVVDHYPEPLELQFAVNFMGHFILINRLLPLVKAAPAGRLAIVASEGYVTAPKKVGIAFDDLDFSSKKYDALETYGHSKLAVMLFNKEMARRLEGSTVTANSVHPGVIRTNLASDTKSFMVKIISAFAGPWTRSVAQGAATHCFVSAHPSLNGVNGLHFADCNPKEPTGFATDMAMAAKLWVKAEELAAEFLL